MSVAYQASEDPLCGNDTNVDNWYGSLYSHIFIIKNSKSVLARSFRGRLEVVGDSRQVQRG